MNKFLVVLSLLAGVVPAVAADGLDMVLVGPVPGRYVVTLSDAAVGAAPGDLRAAAEVRSLAEDLARIYDARVERTWGNAINGFVIEGLEADMAEQLARNPMVVAVEPDREWRFVSAAGNCYGSGPFPTDTRGLPSSSANSSQSITCSNPSSGSCIDNWGLDRVDQRNKPGNGFYSWGDNGFAVHIYLIDTGIDQHREFRDHLGLQRVDRTNAADYTNDGNTYDCYGHGTHVAAIAAGRTFGVAKDSILHPVKFGTLCTSPDSMDSWLLSAVDFVRVNVAQRQWPAVANLSGGNTTALTQSVAFRTAVTNLINSGVQFVQAAGNNNLNACNRSLGGTTDTLVVAGSTVADARWNDGASGSNYGSCVDLFAPAKLINAAKFVAGGNGNGFNAEYCELTGTSMAAPHVSGALAIYLDANPSLTTAQLRSLVINDATGGKLTGIGSGSPNKLLYIP